jgi:hypothetical protein
MGKEVTASTAPTNVAKMISVVDQDSLKLNPDP